MEPESFPPVSHEEARASLEEIDRVILLTRQAIVRSGSAPIVILWGIIWLIGYAGAQFFPQGSRTLWMVLDVAGIAGSFHFGRLARKSPTRSPNRGRIGLSWLILYLFAAIWLALLGPWNLVGAHQLSNEGPELNRKIAAFWATIPMFAYVLMGLWLDRFFIWLGALVTIATLVGYFYVTDCFFLWMAVFGGGALVASGLFIRKNWK
jgi:hypothetical protein